ncbi:MAG: DUF4180 domain-containing protein [Eubacteriales bacterium]
MKTLKIGNITVSLIDKNTIISNSHEILDIMASTRYNEDCDNVGMIIHEESLGDKFFDLKTRFAGELLQKFSNYNMSLVIVGDFAKYKSKSLRDFIRECNRGNQVFFLPSIEDGIAKYETMHS